MMSQGSKRELVGTIRARFLNAPRKEKGKIIDEFIANTGYHRKYAIRLLKRGYPAKKKKRSGTQEEIPGRGGAGLGTHMGDLWADLFKTLEAIYSGDGRDIGAAQGNET